MVSVSALEQLADQYFTEGELLLVGVLRGLCVVVSVKRFFSGGSGRPKRHLAGELLVLLLVKGALVG